MIRRRRPPAQSWRTFLRNHAETIAAIDLCVVPSVRFECLFAFVIIGHGQRQLLWFAVTLHPTAEWLAQQIVEAFPWETAQTYLVRDNDGDLPAEGSDDGDQRPTNLTPVTLAKPVCGTPDRNAAAQLPRSHSHLSQAALRRVLTAYFRYYNETRTHLSLDKDAPFGPAIQRHGAIAALPILSGLCPDIIFGNHRSKPIVETTSRSKAAMCGAWFRKNVPQLCPDGSLFRSS